MPLNDFQPDPAEHLALTQHICRVLKSGKIIATRMPLTPKIQLFLLHQDYPQHELSREQMQALMSEPPFWSFAWSSGQVLAKWILERRELVEGRSVIDFGTGSGIVAVAAACSGARRVVACDIDPLSLEAVKANAALNHVEIAVSGDFEKAAAEEFEVILAADVLYDAEILPLVKSFPDLASEVVLADSRVRDLALELYRKIDQGMAVTCPDLQEPEEFRHVSIYAAHSRASAGLQED